MLRSMASAFLMYSRIPVPKVEWKEENRRYALCFFPLIGIVIGAFFLLWRYVSILSGTGSFLYGTVSMLIPILITGGIHMDGFCDVCDAVSSYGNRKKKLDIMNDPHIGSFALIKAAVYLIFQASLFSEISNTRTAIIVAMGFVLSRVLSGLAAVSFKSAKSSGALQSFVVPAHKKITMVVLIFFLIAVSAFMIVVEPFVGIDCITAASGIFAYYRLFSYKNFGGITGDLAGWFLQMCEIGILIMAVAGEKIMEVSVR